MDFETQTFNLQGMLDKFRKKKGDIDKTFRDIFDFGAAEGKKQNKSRREQPDAVPADEEAPAPAEDTETLAKEPEAVSEPEPETQPDTKPEQPEPAPAVNTADISADIDKLRDAVSAVDIRIDALSSSVESMNLLISENISAVSKSVDTANGRLTVSDKKLSDITNSLASISKLNDSIFDLKNTQMNTRNALGSLEGSFYKLKRKMNVSVIIISILTALIAVMEVINLLS